MVHIERLIKLLQLQPGSYLMKAKEGLDGSRRHSVYNQQGSVAEPTQHDRLDVCSSTISHQTWL